MAILERREADRREADRRQINRRQINRAQRLRAALIASSRLDLSAVRRRLEQQTRHA